MWVKIKRWYNGETKMDEPIIGPDFFMVSPPYTEYHWTARVARAVVLFCFRHWQWVWGTAIALAGLYVAVLSLKGN